MRIGTHNGRFHADDVFAVALLLLTRLFRGAEVVRTRDTAVLAQCDARVDVGFRYNPNTHDYDHHQRGGAGKRRNGIPYAAFGLVWKQFGVELCGDDEAAARRIERRLVIPIDASDHAIKFTQPQSRQLRGYSISNAIADLNALSNGWEIALSTASSILQSHINRAKDAKRATRILEEAVLSSFDPQVVVLSAFCVWTDVIHSVAPYAKFVVFPRKRHQGAWAVCVVQEPNGDPRRQYLFPESWAGLTEEPLERVSGIKGMQFCHNARHMLLTHTREAAIQVVSQMLGIKPPISAHGEGERFSLSPPERWRVLPSIVL